MEKVFIQKIFQITEQVLRRDIDDETALRELHNHLAKAQKLNMPLYEVEVLNTLGVLAVMRGNLPESVQWWTLALDKTQAFAAPSLETQLKLLSNISASFIHIGDLQEATLYAERSLDLIETHQIRNLSSLYAYNVAADCYMMQGRYADP